MHDMRTLMTNMASKRQFADFILDSDWLKSFRYQCYCSGWLLVVQSVRKNQQSAEKMGVFWWCACWRHQFESNISVNPSLCRIFLVPNVSRLCEGLIALKSRRWWKFANPLEFLSYKIFSYEDKIADTFQNFASGDASLNGSDHTVRFMVLLLHISLQLQRNFRKQNTRAYLLWKELLFD
jgi:hypothetical protein